MRDNLDGVAVFVAAVEAGGFSRAAERLALSRSAVGKTIARLEARLGVRLFHRTTRSQCLTEEGQVYFERCLTAIEELRKGEALLDSGRREVTGPLKISAPVLFGRYCVQPVLLALARQHPGLQLDLRYSDAVVNLVAEGFDLAIRNGRPGEGSGLMTRRIATQRKVVCAAPDYISAHGRPKAVDDLSHHTALVYWRHEQLFPWRFVLDDGPVVEADLNWRLQFDNQEAIADAAVMGMGLAWLPEWLIRAHVDAGRLMILGEGLNSTPLETFAVWPAANTIPLRLRAAIDALSAGLGRLE